jgi:small subunit ribosomal protein S2
MPTKIAEKEKVTKEMLEAGVHFGHKRSKWNPKMAPFVFGIRNNIYIIDLTQTYERLEQALAFLEEASRQGKTMVIVGTAPQASSLAKSMAENAGIFYVVERWIGGTLTNYPEISKRLEHYQSLLEKKESGELEKYTKKEQHEFEKELAALEKKWGGLRNLKAMPEVLIVLDISRDYLAVKEAREKGITTVALTDTNTDPTLVDFPIPANDDALSSLKYLLGRMEKAILKGKGKKKS